MSAILSIESSGNVCSVALHRNGALISIKESSEPNVHAKTLAIFIKEILNENNLKASKLKAIAISAGPGSYTGLRIGTSLAKGICFASNVPFISVNTLQTLAFNIKQKCGEMPANSMIMPMVDARRMEVYTEVFAQNLKSVSDTFPVVLNDDFNKFLNPEKLYFTGGNGALKLLKTEMPQNLKLIENIEFSADITGKLAFSKFEKKQFENLAIFEPVYLKEFAEVIKK